MDLILVFLVSKEWHVQRVASWIDYLVYFQKMKYHRLTWLLSTCTPFSRSLSHGLPCFFWKDCIPDLPHSSQVPGERRVGKILWFKPWTFDPRNVGGHLNHPKKVPPRFSSFPFLHLFLKWDCGKFSYLFSSAIFFSFRAQYVGVIFTAQHVPTTPPWPYRPEARGNVASSNGFWKWIRLARTWVASWYGNSTTMVIVGTSP